MTPTARALPPCDAPLPSPFLVALTEGLEEVAPAELDRRLCRAAKLEQGLHARIAPLLVALARARGHLALGYRSLDSYARARLGLSARAVRALLRLGRACELSARLSEAWRSGRLTTSQAQALLPLFAIEEAERFHAGWIARTELVTLRRLEDDAEHALAARDLDPEHLPPLPAGVQIGARPMLSEPNETWVANVPADVARLFRACLCSVQRRLRAGPGAALEAMFVHCIETWRTPTPRDQRVIERDGFRCTVPGCTSYRNLHAHHVVFRSAGGGDEDANLTTLCAAHHQRFVHGGVIRISGRAPGALVFELPIGRFRSGDLVSPACSRTSSGKPA